MAPFTRIFLSIIVGVLIILLSAVNGYYPNEKTVLSPKETINPDFEGPDGENFVVWGKPYQMQIVYSDRRPAIERDSNRIRLRQSPGTGEKVRKAFIEGWYRKELYDAVVPLVAKWEPILGVSVNRIVVHRMKTQWGSCDTATGVIRFNTQLVKMSPEFMEQIVVSEMTKLLAPSQSGRLRALMDS